MSDIRKILVNKIWGELCIDRIGYFIYVYLNIDIFNPMAYIKQIIVDFIEKNNDIDIKLQGL